MAVVLATAAGGVDAIGYLTLSRLFTAHMTGNTAAAAIAIGHHAWSESFRRFFPIPMFVAGVVAGGLVKRLSERSNMPAKHFLPLSLEAVVLAAFWALGSRFAAGMQLQSFTYYSIASLPAVAMGIQTTTLRRIADHSIRTTFITGMLAVFGEQLVEWWLLRRRRLSSKAARSDRERAAKARVLVTAAIWSAYVAGALGCTLFERRGRYAAVALPLVAISASVLLDWRGSRQARRRAGSPVAEL